MHAHFHPCTGLRNTEHRTGCNDVQEVISTKYLTHTSTHQPARILTSSYTGAAIAPSSAGTSVAGASVAAAFGIKRERAREREKSEGTRKAVSSTSNALRARRPLARFVFPIPSAQVLGRCAKIERWGTGMTGTEDMH